MESHSFTAPVVKWKLADLKEHPSQRELFADLTDDEMQRLASDMQANGQRTPIELLPDGTVICGHQRVRAAGQLGWNEIDAVVRDDLKSKGSPYVMTHLIADNVNRRQLGPLDIARCYRRLRLEATDMDWGDGDEYRGIDHRDVLAKQFNMSGRNLDRLVRVLATPMAVQTAVAGARLSVKAAGKVAGLKQSLQDVIAKQIMAGGEPEQVVAGFVSKATGRRKRAWRACDALVTSIQRGLADLEGRIAEVKSLTPERAEVLRRGQETIAQILKQVEIVKPAEAQKVQAELVERLKNSGGREALGQDGSAGHGVRHVSTEPVYQDIGSKVS
jgi:hypothetical protein